MTQRLLALILIFLCTSAAWFILGGTMLVRSEVQDGRLRGKVAQLWGSVQRQEAPCAYYERKKEVETKRTEDGRVITEIKTQLVREGLPLEKSDVQVGLSLEHRRKGLLWYSTYKVRFAGRYVITNTTSEPRQVLVEFPFPAEGAVYDNFRWVLGGRVVEQVVIREGKAVDSFRLEPGASGVVEVGYDSQGLDQWWYDFGKDVSQVKDFRLVMTTDFDRIDFPPNSIAPTSKKQVGRGWELEWRYVNLLTGEKIGMELPKKLNPGPWVSQVTFFAPVSLFLFFFLLFIFTTIRGINLHPMNYFFVGAAFFSFHLLMAYLVDHVSIHVAFAISAAVSVLLVVSYMRLVVGARVAFVEVALAQLVYLVLFAYAFFFEGYTGLAITILCVVTLFVVMQMTGRTNWETIVKKERMAVPPRLAD